MTRLSGLKIDANTIVLSVVNTSAVVLGGDTPILITVLAGNGGSAELTESLSMRVTITAAEVDGLSLAEPLQRFGNTHSVRHM